MRNRSRTCFSAVVAAEATATYYQYLLRLNAVPSSAKSTVLAMYMTPVAQQHPVSIRSSAVRYSGVPVTSEMAGVMKLTSGGRPLGWGRPCAAKPMAGRIGRAPAAISE